jgi:hypothetical protein
MPQILSHLPRTPFETQPFQFHVSKGLSFPAFLSARAVRWGNNRTSKVFRNLVGSEAISIPHERLRLPRPPKASGSQ